jgi:hypothetical protein
MRCSFVSIKSYLRSYWNKKIVGGAYECEELQQLANQEVTGLFVTPCVLSKVRPFFGKR